MQVWVGGYSPGAAFAELFLVTLPSGRVERLRKPGEQTIRWLGCSEAINTLWWGANQHALLPLLTAEGLDEAKAARVAKGLREACAWGPERLNWGMPLHSAVDLVRFLLTVQIQYERFQPGRARCGFPLQVVALSPTGPTWVEQPFPW